MRASRSRQQHHLKQNNERFSFLNLQRPRFLRSGQKSRSLQNLSFNSRHFKLGLRAKGLSLLSLALRPGLLGCGAVVGFLLLNVLIDFVNVADVSAASLTLSVPSSTLSLNIEPNNTFQPSSPAQVKVKTDALAGYTLSIKAKSEDNSLINSETSSKLSSLSTKVSDYQDEGASNTWGYQPDKFESAENADFLPGPTTEASTIDKTSVKNDENNTYTITLGAKVDTALPTGIYTNTFVFLASANSFKYTINYDLQGASTGPTTPQTGSTIDATVKLDSTPPTKSGYEFLGWCSVEPTNNNSTTPTCSGTTYQPGGDYTFTDPVSSTVTLYAIWKQTGNYMQNWSGCSTLSQGQSIELIDKRDNNKYKISKLKDGKCWMVQNLRIVGVRTLTPEDSDINSNFSLPASSLSGFTSQNTAYNYFIDDNYGSIYSYYAATAGAGSTSMGQGYVNTSICPKGWRLPTGGDNSDTKAWIEAYGSNPSSMLSSADGYPGMVLTGWYDGASGWVSRGTCGYLWTSYKSGAGGSCTAYDTNICTTSVSYQTCGYNEDGESVRCIAR